MRDYQVKNAWLVLNSSLLTLHLSLTNSVYLRLKKSDDEKSHPHSDRWLFLYTYSAGGSGLTRLRSYHARAVSPCSA